MKILEVNPKIKNIIFLFITIGLLWSLKLYSANFGQLAQEEPFNISSNQFLSEEEESDKDSNEFDYFILSSSVNKIIRSEHQIKIQNCLFKIELNSLIPTPPPNFS